MTQGDVGSALIIKGQCLSLGWLETARASLDGACAVLYQQLPFPWAARVGVVLDRSSRGQQIPTDGLLTASALTCTWLGSRCLAQVGCSPWLWSPG